ncbi:MAG: YihY family inner membrane protein [Deltaproteobacteria bacterium]|jgi:membrane protein|nr:YihY family inner membrane protein [Deltaproteobacteria bacterium]MBW2498887.1 YihY family inner membrane protein [Deltaproteobacteria bacterium]
MSEAPRASRWGLLALLRGGVGRLASIPAQLDRELWRLAPGESFLLRALRSLAQLVALTVRGFQTDRLLLRASALTYITALSIIPMLGVVFAIIGMVGGNERLIDYAIEQLTTVAPEARETVRGYINNLDLSGLGTIGGALFFGTAVLTLRHLEMTLNDIWGVSRSRSWARRFSDYLAVMVVAPISTGVAISVATTIQSQTILARLLDDPDFARVYGFGLEQLPLLSLLIGFTFLYWFFPNTNVRLRAAALGGGVAAVLFLAARSIYVEFQVGVATYQAVFGALSAVPLILAWLYACWAIVLLGAEVAFATQNLAFARREMRAGETSAAEAEGIALELAVAIGRAFRERQDPPTAERLADELDEPVRAVRKLLGVLESAALIRCVAADRGQDGAWVPGRPLAALMVGHVLRAVRGETSDEGGSDKARDPRVSEALERLEGAWGEIADRVSLDSLLVERESEVRPEGA